MKIEIPHFVPHAVKAILAFSGAVSTPPIVAVFVWITFVALLISIIVHAFAGAANAVLDVIERARAVPAKPPPQQD